MPGRVASGATRRGTRAYPERPREEGTETARTGRGLSFLERARLRRRAPLLTAVGRALEVNSSTRLLDLGGGSGAVSEVLGAGAREVVVIDPSPRRLRAGRAKRPRVGFVEANAEDLPFGAERFERVVSTMAFHHFRSPDRVVAEVQRVLTPHGRWVLSDIDPTTPMGRRLRWFESHLARRSHNFEAPPRLRARISNRGLAVVAESTVGPFYILIVEPPGDRKVDSSLPGRA